MNRHIFFHPHSVNSTYPKTHPVHCFVGRSRYSSFLIFLSRTPHRKITLLLYNMNLIHRLHNAYHCSFNHFTDNITGRLVSRPSVILQHDTTNSKSHTSQTQVDESHTWSSGSGSAPWRSNSFTIGAELTEAAKCKGVVPLWKYITSPIKHIEKYRKSYIICMIDMYSSFHQCNNYFEMLLINCIIQRGISKLFKKS